MSAPLSAPSLTPAVLPGAPASAPSLPPAPVIVDAEIVSDDEAPYIPEQRVRAAPPRNSDVRAIPDHNGLTHYPQMVKNAARIAARKKKRMARTPILDKRLRKWTALIVALRINGKTNSEIAEELGLSLNTIKSYIRRAMDKGYLKASDMSDPEDWLEHVIVPRVLGNVEELLLARDEKTGLPLENVTLEAAKGTGVFKNHSVNKSAPVAQTMMALKVEVVMPPNSGTPVPISGMMGGSPLVDVSKLEKDDA